MNYVEIIGPAGAGKTTLKNHLVNGDHIISNQNALDAAIRHSIPLPSVVTQTLPNMMCKFYWDHVLSRRYQVQFEKEYSQTSYVFNKIGQLDHRSSFPERYFQIASEFIAVRDLLSGQSSYSKSIREKTMLFDEGLIQYMSTIIRLGSETLVEQYFNQTPMPDLVINIDCSSKIALDRQNQRNKGKASSLTALDRERAIERLEQSRNHFDLICNQLEDENIPTITINSELYSPKECAEVIKNHSNWIKQ